MNPHVLPGGLDRICVSVRVPRTDRAINGMVRECFIEETNVVPTAVTDDGGAG
jgi:hypothetical protein